MAVQFTTDPMPHRQPLLTLSRCGLFLAALLAAGTPAVAQTPDSTLPLEIRFLDVGQADAILIKSGKIGVLVDAGRGDDIVLVLAEEGIDSLAAAIASHNHDDHIGGMDAVLSDYPVGEYLYNGRPPANYNAENVEKWLREKRIPAPAPPWRPIQLGDTRITVFPSPLAPRDATENTSSLGVLIERGKFRALLTGDSEVEELNAWMRARKIPRVNVLKAAHHGARNGMNLRWLQVTDPEAVVISVGANNSYGHPDPWALRYYGTHNRKIYRTDRDGTVVVTVDEKGGYSIQTLGPIER